MSGPTAEQTALASADDPGKVSLWQTSESTQVLLTRMNQAIRPPLVSEWESSRLLAFTNRSRRAAWMAGRSLAKFLLTNHAGLRPIIDLRDDEMGRPVLYRDGAVDADHYLDVSTRGQLIAAALSDRPVGLAWAPIDEGPGMNTTRRERARLARQVGDPQTAVAAVRAAKEAALRCAGLASTSLDQVSLERGLGMVIHGAQPLQLSGVHVAGGGVLCVVELMEPAKRSTRIRLDAQAAQRKRVHRHWLVRLGVAKVTEADDAK